MAVIVRTLSAKNGSVDVGSVALGGAVVGACGKIFVVAAVVLSLQGRIGTAEAGGREGALLKFCAAAVVVYVVVAAFPPSKLCFKVVPGYLTGTVATTGM